ncbi:MAG: hypothetical protein JNM88_02645 [Chitinophagaceae bacterium]|nr:hypothetical protein [Chitinophagaceae bacterium]
MEKEPATYRGKVSFINHEKFFATIEYRQGAKQKSVNCKINADDINKKPHQFRLGDVVSFQLRLSDRGDKMTAYNVKYLHNEAIDLLIQKSALENRFSGYLKKVDDKYFVKELNSYILFPLKLSPWEMPPAQAAENVAIAFSLANLEKPNALVAELFCHSFIPEYKMAWQHFINEIDADAIVTRISPHAVYLGLFDNKIQAKLSLKDAGNEKLKEGDTIPVKITHLSEDKIAVKRLSSLPEEPVVQQ